MLVRHGHHLTASEYNELIDELARLQGLRGTTRDAEGSASYHWKVTVQQFAPAASNNFGINPLTGKPFFSSSVFSQKASLLWQVFVGPGAINDQLAAIQYLAKDDPRGWVMPPNYAPYAALQKIYGSSYPYVDRDLTESPTPFLLLTAPNASGNEPGGFTKVEPFERPDFFKTAAMWNLDLYIAYVYVSLTPYQADPIDELVQIHGAPVSRWRVFAGQRPTAIIGSGTAGIASKELARIYLTRDPGKPQNDKCYVQQTCFWSLAAHSVYSTGLLQLIGAGAAAAAGLDLGLLSIGLVGITVATALVGIEAGLVAILMANLEEIIADTSQVLFWTDG